MSYPGQGGHRIKLRIFIPLILAMGVLLLSFVLALRHDQQNRDKDYIRRSASDLQNILHIEQGEQVAVMTTAIQSILQDDEMARALLARDRNALLRLALPLQKSLETRHKVTHFYFHGPDRINILRLHHPDQHSDLINRFTLLEAERTGKITSGLERGPIGAFVLRVVVPWRADGKLLGYVELGTEFENIALTIQELLAVDFVVTVDKKFINQQKWIEAQTSLGKQVPWDQLPNEVVVSSTFKTVPEPILKFLASDVHETSKMNVAFWDGRAVQMLTMRLGVTNGEEFGELCVMRDVTDSVAQARRSVWLIGVICFGVSAVLLTFFYIFLGRVERTLADRSAKLHVEIEERARTQHAHDELEIRVQERTSDLAEANSALQVENSERKRAELVLRESEVKFHLLADNISDVFWIASPDLRQSLYVSPGYEPMFGRTVAQQYANPMQWPDAIVPEDHERAFGAFLRLASGEESMEVEYRIARPDGSICWIYDRGFQVRDPSGKVIRVTGIASDITQRKQADTALRESEERLRFLSNLAEVTRTLANPALIMAATARMLGEHLLASRCAYADVAQDGEQFTIVDDYTDGCESTVGSYHLSLFGARAVAELRRGETLIVRNVDSELLRDEGADMFNAIGIKAIICCPLIKNGGLRALMAVHSTTPRDWQPAEIALVQETVERCWTTIDQRNAEDKLRESDEKFHQLADHINDTFWIRSPDMREIHYISPAFERIWGRSVNELLTNPEIWNDFTVLEDRERVRAAFVTLTKDAPSLDIEYRIQRPDGAIRWIRVRGFQVLNAAKQLIRLTGIVTDITDRKKAEGELEKTNWKLLEASRRAGMAEVATEVLHNVGNVLNSVNVASSCVAESLRKSKSADLAKVAALMREHESDLGNFVTHDPRGKNLTRFFTQLAVHLSDEQAAVLKELAGLQKNIEHIKAIVKMQQNIAKVPALTESLSAAELVEDALKINASGIIRHSIQIVREFANMPLITVEKHKLLQILVNLIRNAKEACTARGPKDRRLVLGVSNGQDRVRISVSDNGEGMPPGLTAALNSPSLTIQPLYRLRF